MDNLHQLFLERHSIRRYTDAPVDPDHVRLILQAALLSPSSKSKRPWQFVVVENRDTLARLAECKDFGTKPIGTCAFGVVVAVDAAESDCFVEDASIAAAFMDSGAQPLHRRRHTRRGHRARDARHSGKSDGGMHSHRWPQGRAASTRRPRQTAVGESTH